MKHTTYYLVQPNQQLLDYFSENPSDVDVFFTDSMLWGKNHDKGYYPDAYEQEVKILHIIEILDTGRDVRGEEYGLVVKKLFGEPPYTIETFDKWWIIINCGNFVQETRPYYEIFDHKLLLDIGKTGIYWLDKLRDEAKDK